MITLRISFPGQYDQQEYVIDNMCDEGLNNFDCHRYMAVVKGNRENGLCFNFYDEILEKDFKTEIWDKICVCIAPNDSIISCAYVESPYYKGCIWNWPGVFRESKCP